MARGRPNGQWALAICFGVLGFAGALAAAGMTGPGHTIDMAVMHFLLFYAGVFALIGLTAAVGAGLLAADRIVMTPNRRIIAQAVHRAVSFGAVGFLMIHIVTEIIAGRSHPVDAVVPFLGERRALYLGLGTLASDLFLLVLVTGIMRGRFATLRPTWMWRALHAVAYVAWPLGILHGLLDGRTAKPYVDWSYGACLAVVALALIVRLVVAARVQETAGSPVPAAPPWLSAGGAGPWLPGATVAQIEPVRAYPRAVARPPLALPPAPAHGRSTPSRGMPVPPGGMSTPPRGTPMPPGRMSTPPRGTPVPPRGRPMPPPGMSTPPRGTAVPPRGRPMPPPGMSTPPRGTAVPPRGRPMPPPGMSTPPRGTPVPPRGMSVPPGRMSVPPGGMSSPPRGMPMPPRGMVPPSPPTGMPAYPGYAVGDRDYPGPDDPADYYHGPDDEDDDPGWADGDDPDAGYLDAEDYGPGELAEDDDPEWDDEEGYGPGPGPGYPHADASHLGWAR
jgi:hypothetical protein